MEIRRFLELCLQAVSESIYLSHCKCVVYWKLTGQEHRTAADLIQAPQRLVYVSQKCTELPPEHLTATNPRIAPNPNITCSPCACSSRWRCHSQKELLTPRSAHHRSSSLLLFLCRGCCSGSGFSLARQIYAQGPHGIELGHQRLRHQRGPASGQCLHGILFPSLAPASLVFNSSGWSAS
jgi:hypothetical protein